VFTSVRPSTRYSSYTRDFSTLWVYSRATVLPSFTGSATYRSPVSAFSTTRTAPMGGGHCDDDEREHREREDHGTGVWLKGGPCVW